MKRREALQGIIVLSAGIMLTPGCRLKDEILDESSGLITFNKRSAEFIRLLSQLILPDPESGHFSTPEAFESFVSNMVNTCDSPEDITKFGLGYAEYCEYLQTQFKKSLSKMNNEELESLLTQVSDEELLSENARYFFQKTRNLRISHFTSSEYYMTNFENYEMAPGRFSGCIPANS